MTLGSFLDAAYASLVEEYRRLGTDLQTALAELEEYRAGGPSGDTEFKEEAATQRRSEAAEVLENQKAMAELQKMMASTGMRLG